MVLCSIASTDCFRLVIPFHFVDTFNSLRASMSRPWRNRVRAVLPWCLALDDAVVIAPIDYGLGGGVVKPWLRAVSPTYKVGLLETDW